MGRRNKEWLVSDPVSSAANPNLLMVNAAGRALATEANLATNERQPIERELVVVKRCLNPKLIMCEYRELESVRRCLVNVRSNTKFAKGMKMRMEEPVTDADLVRPWVYRGRLPRLKGRW
jgi:hypothetical protein